MKISIVSPVYKAEKIIPVLVDRIEKAVSKITDNYEIILVDDCGPDRSWEVIENITVNNPKIIGIKLSRNFGQHHAITAGLDYAKGDWVVVMDCDLQDQPEEIEKLYKKAIEGFDIVLASRLIRKDNLVKRYLSSLFYKLFGYLTGTDQDPSIANFGIYNRKVINAVCSLRESTRFFPTTINWVGFKNTKLDVDHDSRFEGETSYDLKKLFQLSFNIIIAYSDKPIRLLIKFGLLVSFFSFALAIRTFIQWLNGEILVLGYSSIMISIWFLSGVIISTLGIVGLYVGKTFEGIKNRPIYIIDKITE